ncbi:MAG: enoyl-CoA hydratase-related protein [Thermodesulfobacteriota bacterium]|nr:enoyl-CoA hydratase-related protein [Thermodesulfobacteriota bacterium]
MKTLLVERKEAIAIIQLCRPSCLNAVNTKMVEELQQQFEVLQSDEKIKGILLTGADGHFAAGVDLQEIRHFSPLEAISFAENGQQLCSLIESFPRPVLAAVSGYALGAGLEIALSCDYILADATAQFGFRELCYGVLPAFGGTQRLPRLVGKARAKEILFTGQMVSAEEALNIGLVNRLFPQESLHDDVLQQLQKISSYGLLSLQMGKEVIDTGYEINLRAACKMERDAFAVCFSTQDQKEGMGAFIEKRQPRFTGR